MTAIPIVVGPQGRVNTPPATLLANLLAAVAAVNPGYTATLPGSLIEDISSTDVGALVTIDQALTDLINCINPLAANPYSLAQLGVLYGVPQGQDSNTAVYVVFSGTVGFNVPPGFTVSDGSHQYIVQAPGTIIGSGGSSEPVYCVATTAGIWAVPAGTVTTLVTSVPGAVTLSVTNPLAGIPSPGPQSLEEYQAQVIQAGLATSTGAPTLLRTALGKVPGVQPRLISIRQQSPGWQVICGGGDPYEVAFAIFNALFDVSNLQASVIGITGITKANPGVVTTDLNHGLTTGQTNVHIAGVLGMTAANGGPYTVTVIDEKTFSFGVNTSGYSTYTGGGVVTPNTRNVTVSINDYPDTYAVTFVGNPPQQTVAIAVNWETNSPNSVSSTAVAQVAAPAVANYINGIPVGAPINELEMDAVFQTAVAGLVPSQFIIKLDWTVSINSVVTAPDAGTRIVSGDPESYFQCSSTDVTVTQV